MAIGLIDDRTQNREEDMNFSEIIFDVKDSVALLTLNRPDIRNAITGEKMVEEIESACRMAQESSDINVMIVTGAGPAFSSGGNIKDMKKRRGLFGGSPEEIKENYRRGIQRVPLAFHRLDIPTIAAVNGPAIGAGCDLACMCDIRIASEKARFGETFVNVGLIPGDGGAFFLPRIVGFSKACELIFTGRIIDANEALQIGLVSQVVKEEDLLGKAKELARVIASKPPRVLRMAKRLVYLAQHMNLNEVLEVSAAYQALCHHTEDHLEAVDAMLEKRTPQFRGK